MLRVSIVVGNPKPASRTLELAEAAARSFVAPAPAEFTTIDLAEHVGEIFTWPSAQMAALSDRVASSDIAVFASPTYKATYTGLLKAFLDRYPAGGLHGVLAIPVMTGANASHSVAPDAHLRPLLVELGATVPTSSLYFVTSNMDRLGAFVGDWAESNRSVLASLARIAGAIDGDAGKAEAAGGSCQPLGRNGGGSR